MPSDHRQEVRRVFMEVADLPEAARAAGLDRACGVNPTLRGEVEALLAADDRAGSFMTHPIAPVGRHARPPADHPGEGPGTWIGPYRLVRLIGEGGFGSVFMAEQERPLARTVALKIIKLGMDTRQVIARFEAERQALVILEHPNIARVIDAGATELGRPYFVMELVDGEPIAEYCDGQSLSITDRLGLFAQVCSAVQHAHTKGIIHRDLKPSNILVTSLDGRPCAKVIDFGIAKATASGEAAATAFTQGSQLIGTPEYMSPEQAEGSPDIDTRTDVYSLGVLLYELLTGSTPFPTRQLRSAAFEEMRRIIREVDPPKPSTRLGSAADTLAGVAATRRIEPARLTAAVRGELDWIVMKSMEKDRARRYESPGALAADIARHLAGEAVLAAPPSAAYRACKFARRHRGAVLAGSAVALALLVGLVAFAWQARIAGRQRDLARQEAARATATNNFMESIFLAANPLSSGSRDMTVVEMLSTASERASRTLADQPRVEAYARALLGSTFKSLGRVEQATRELERAIEIQRSSGETRTVSAAGALRSLGLLLVEKNEFRAALPLLEQAHEIILSLGPERAGEAVIGCIDIARAQLGLSLYPECERSLDRAEALAAATSGVRATDRAYALSVRSNLVAEWKNDTALAEKLAEEHVALRREAADPAPLAEALNGLAVKRMSRGRLDEALALYEEALGLARPVLGEGHPKVAMMYENCGNVHYRRKDFDLAQEMLDRALKIREAAFGQGSMQAARTRLNMAAIAVERKDFPRALAMTDLALPLFRESSGEKSMEYATALRLHAECLAGTGQPDAAIDEYAAALAILEAIVPLSSPMRMRCLQGLAEAYCLKGSYDDAERTARLATDALDAGVPTQAKWIATFDDLLAGCRTPPAP